MNIAKFRRTEDTDPLNSAWSIGRGNCSIHFDFCETEDGQIKLHSTYDFESKATGNITEDFECVTVSRERAAETASEMVTRAWQFFREQVGRDPQGVKCGRLFIWTVQEYTQGEQTHSF